MKLARYWARGEGEATDRKGGRVRVVARGWSDDTVEAARARAREIALRVAERLISHPGERNRYEYGDRPLPEPVIRQFSDSGPSAGVVTRNIYGALVLSTDYLMFIDVDRPEHTVLSTAEKVASRRDLSARVYKTAAGHRVVVTNREFRAGTSDSEAVLNEFGADHMYVRLCRVQESFRARLTPKPWRCNAPRLPLQFPFETAREQSLYRQWETEYQGRSAGCATCRYLKTFGGVRIAPEFEDLVFYHDEVTKATSNLPLA